MSEEREVVHTRLSKSLVKVVDHYAVEHEIFRQEAIERLLRRGLTAEAFVWPQPEQPAH